MMKGISIAAFGGLVLACVLGAVSERSVYRVGPDEEYAKISQVAAILEPGDVVELTGDITDSFVLTKAGTAEEPIVIRGITRTENGRIVRPRITPELPKDVGSCTIECKADHYLIEGLEIAGLTDHEGKNFLGFRHACDDLVIRNCYFHHHNWKAIVGHPSAGSVRIEFCEFDSNGTGSMFHTVDLFSCTVGSVVTVEHCCFHDGTGGNLFKSHCPRNVIRYNWFESPYFGAVNIVGELMPPQEQENHLQSPLYPMHTDIVGNVFFQGWSPGSRYSILRIGGESPDSPGTEGDFHLAHNLFMTTRTTPGVAPDDETVHLRVQGNVDHVRLYSNVFLEYGVSGAAVYSRARTWDTPRTKAFVERRGSSEPIVEGSNNWASRKALASGLPATLKDTIRGTIRFSQTSSISISARRKAHHLPPQGFGRFPRGVLLTLCRSLSRRGAYPLISSPCPAARPPRLQSGRLKAEARSRGGCPNPCDWLLPQCMIVMHNFCRGKGPSATI